MDVTSLSSYNFHRLFGEPAELISSFSSGENYEDDDSTGRYRAWLIVAYCALLTVGVIGNIWVVSVISCVLRASNNPNGYQAAKAPRAIQIFILTLCCSDLIVLAFLLFLIADLIHGQWILPLHTSICRLYLSSESLNKFCGPFLLVGLSGYCYISVCKRRWRANLHLPISSSYVTPLIIGSIVVLVLVLICPVYIYGDVQFLIVHNASAIYSITPKCALQPPENVLTAFTIYSFICAYVVPASLFTFFYASILIRVYKQAQIRAKRMQQTRKDQPSGQKERRRRGSYLSRTVKTSMGLVMFYLVCWTPYWTMCLRQYLTPHRTTIHSNTGVLFGYLIHMLPYINCTGYPILYTVLNKAIKDAYMKASYRRRNDPQADQYLFFQMRLNSAPGQRFNGRRMTEFSSVVSADYTSNSQLPSGHISS